MQNAAENLAASRQISLNSSEKSFWTAEAPQSKRTLNVQRRTSNIESEMAYRHQARRDDRK